VAQLGAALLDIQENSGVSFFYASTYITLYSIGNLLSPIIYKCIQSRLNIFFASAVIYFALTLCMLTLPRCDNYSEIVCIFLVLGVCHGLSDISKFGIKYRHCNDKQMMGNKYENVIFTSSKINQFPSATDTNFFRLHSFKSCITTKTNLSKT